MQYSRSVYQTGNRYSKKLCSSKMATKHSLIKSTSTKPFESKQGNTNIEKSLARVIYRVCIYLPFSAMDSKIFLYDITGHLERTIKLLSVPSLHFYVFCCCYQQLNSSTASKQKNNRPLSCRFSHFACCKQIDTMLVRNSKQALRLPQRDRHVFIG